MNNHATIASIFLLFTGISSVSGMEDWMGVYDINMSISDLYQSHDSLFKNSEDNLFQNSFLDDSFCTDNEDNVHKRKHDSSSSDELRISKRPKPNYESNSSVVYHNSGNREESYPKETCTIKEFDDYLGDKAMETLYNQIFSGTRLTARKKFLDRCYRQKGLRPNSYSFLNPQKFYKLDGINFDHLKLNDLLYIKMLYFFRQLPKAFYNRVLSLNIINDPDGCILLGLMYWLGNGVDKNHVEAVRLYKQAAFSGNAEGQCRLGCMYASGKGVIQSFKEARRLYTLSANKGNAEAQTHLGHLYEIGIEGAQDLNKAFRLYTFSANQGYALGQYRLGRLYLLGKGIAKDLNRAFRLCALSARQGDPKGQGQLGLMYALGNGVEKDLKKAVELIESAVQILPGAQTLLDRVKRKLWLQEQNKTLRSSPASPYESEFSEEELSQTVLLSPESPVESKLTGLTQKFNDFNMIIHSPPINSYFEQPLSSTHPQTTHQIQQTQAPKDPTNINQVEPGTLIQLEDHKIDQPPFQEEIQQTVMPSPASHGESKLSVLAQNFNESKVIIPSHPINPFLQQPLNSSNPQAAIQKNPFLQQFLSTPHPQTAIQKNPFLQQSLSIPNPQTAIQKNPFHQQTLCFPCLQTLNQVGQAQVPQDFSYQRNSLYFNTQSSQSQAFTYAASSNQSSSLLIVNQADLSRLIQLEVQKLYQSPYQQGIVQPFMSIPSSQNSIGFYGQSQNFNQSSQMIRLNPTNPFFQQPLSLQTTNQIGQLQVPQDLSFIQNHL